MNKGTKIAFADEPLVAFENLETWENGHYQSFLHHIEYVQFLKSNFEWLS